MYKKMSCQTFLLTFCIVFGSMWWVLWCSTSALNLCLMFQKNVNELPDKILLHCFSFLRHREICYIACVCKKWRLLAYDSRLWSRVSLRPEYSMLQVSNVDALIGLIGTPPTHSYIQFWQEYNEVRKNVKWLLCRCSFRQYTPLHRAAVWVGHHPSPPRACQQVSSKQTTSVISPNHFLIRALFNPDLFGVAELEVHDSGFRQCNAAARVQRPQRVSLQPPLLVHLPLRSHLPRRLHA